MRGSCSSAAAGRLSGHGHRSIGAERQVMQGVAAVYRSPDQTAASVRGQAVIWNYPSRGCNDRLFLPRGPAFATTRESSDVSASDCSGVSLPGLCRSHVVRTERCSGEWARVPRRAVRQTPHCNCTIGTIDTAEHVNRRSASIRTCMPMIPTTTSFQASSLR